MLVFKCSRHNLGSFLVQWSTPYHLYLSIHIAPKQNELLVRHICWAVIYIYFIKRPSFLMKREVTKMVISSFVLLHPQLLSQTIILLSSAKYWCVCVIFSHHVCFSLHFIMTPLFPVNLFWPFCPSQFNLFFVNEVTQSPSDKCDQMMK